jgi:hypothetical protein
MERRTGGTVAHDPMDNVRRLHHPEASSQAPPCKIQVPTVKPALELYKGLGNFH